MLLHLAKLLNLARREEFEVFLVILLAQVEDGLRKVELRFKVALDLLVGEALFLAVFALLRANQRMLLVGFVHLGDVLVVNGCKLGGSGIVEAEFVGNAVGHVYLRWASVALTLLGLVCAGRAGYTEQAHGENEKAVFHS